MYVTDYDESFPPMKTPSQVERLIHPYARDGSLYVCPQTGAHYLPNPAMGYISLSAIRLPAKSLIVRDATPHGPAPQTSSLPKSPWWNAAYANWHVQLDLAEPVLGKPATPLSKSTLMRIRIRQIDEQLRLEKKWKNDMEWEIRRLTAERRRLTTALRSSKYLKAY